MAGGLPPPPTRAASGDFVWIDWYNKLNAYLSTGGSIAWSVINKAGSSIADLQSKAHSLLTSIQGGTAGEHYHLTNTEHTAVQALIARDPKYGVFHDTSTQTAAVINTAYPITFNSTDLSHGVTVGTPTSRIVCSATGVYDFQFSVQLNKTAAAAKKVWIWPRINGTNVANSGTEVTLAGSSAALVASWNFVLSLTANDYFELVWSTDDTGCQITALTATAPVPAIPSIILTVTDNISA